VVPTYVVVQSGGSVYWAWVFASAHIFAMAVCFYLRFRTGKWKAMRVIEAAPGAPGGRPENGEPSGD
jgi:MATE family multidrug resistance protein